MSTHKRRKKARTPAVVLQRLVRSLDGLLRAGQMCSNVCYNLRQRDYIPKDDVRCMTESYQAWDLASQEIANLRAPNRYSDKGGLS